MTPHAAHSMLPSGATAEHWGQFIQRYRKRLGHGAPRTCPFPPAQQGEGEINRTHGQGRLSPRLPRHLRDVRARRRRSRHRADRRRRSPVHARFSLRQGQPLPGARLQPGAGALSAAASRRQGRGALPQDLVGRGTRQRGGRPRPRHAGACAASRAALLVRRQHGVARLRQPRPALLPSHRRQPAGSHDLLQLRCRRLQAPDRQHDRVRPRGDRRGTPDHRLGRQHRQLERSPVAVHPEGPSRRGQAGYDRPLPLEDRREKRRAPGPAAGNRRGAGARDHARPSRRVARTPTTSSATRWAPTSCANGPSNGPRRERPSRRVSTRIRFGSWRATTRRSSRPRSGSTTGSIGTPAAAPPFAPSPACRRSSGRGASRVVGSSCRRLAPTPRTRRPSNGPISSGRARAPST